MTSKHCSKALVVVKPAAKFAGMAIKKDISILSASDTLPHDHVIVKMKASRINAVDMDLTSGSLPFVKIPPLRIGGVDGSGIVTAVGSNVNRVAVGDEVFMYRSFTNFGTWGTNVSVPQEFVTKAPTSLSLEEAGAIALIAPTAYDALFHQLKIERGRSILILGGAGGVGFCAVQFAIATGLKVYANAGSQSSIAKLQAAGVERVINYKTEKLEDHFKPGELDYIFDAAGKDSMSKLIKTLKPTKLCSVSHPNASMLGGVGIELGWIWRCLFGMMTWWDNSTARKSGVELIGQVTPSGHPTLLADVASKIDSMDEKFKVDYKTMNFEDMDGLSDKDLGKVIVFNYN